MQRLEANPYDQHCAFMLGQLMGRGGAHQPCIMLPLQAAQLFGHLSLPLLQPMPQAHTQPQAQPQLQPADVLHSMFNYQRLPDVDLFYPDPDQV